MQLRMRLHKRCIFLMEEYYIHHHLSTAFDSMLKFQCAECRSSPASLESVYASLALSTKDKCDRRQ